MTKKNFLTLVLAVVGGLMFALGMCMCLLPEWNLFKPGTVLTGMGLIVLIALAVVRWVQAGRPMKKVNWRTVGKVTYGVVSCLVLGVGMSMIMAMENMMLPGIIVGMVGIVLMLGLIPVVKGLK